jgi:hypothetical protein
MNWHELAISTEGAIREDWVFPTGERSLSVFEANVIFTPGWNALARSHGIIFSSVQVFYKLPHEEARPHVDMRRNNSPIIFALNWVVGGAESEMHWYETPVEPGEANLTEIGTGFIRWPSPKGMKIIDRYQVKNKLALVNTSIPHGIITGDEHRWCISIRPQSPVFKTWDDAVKGFDHLIVRS